MIKLYLLFTILAFSLIGSSCNSDTESSFTVEETKFKASQELYVFKIDNATLREAIRKKSSFDSIKILGCVDDYSITFVTEGDTKAEAETKLSEVRKFALDWGEAHPNYVPVYKGLDNTGDRKFDIVAESPVKLLPKSPEDSQ